MDRNWATEQEETKKVKQTNDNECARFKSSILEWIDA